MQQKNQAPISKEEEVEVINRRNTEEISFPFPFLSSTPINLVISFALRSSLALYWVRRIEEKGTWSVQFYSQVTWAPSPTLPVVHLNKKRAHTVPLSLLLHCWTGSDAILVTATSNESLPVNRDDKTHQISASTGLAAFCKIGGASWFCSLERKKV